MGNKGPMYYFNIEATPKIIKYDVYDLLSEKEKPKYKPATFSDVELYGSDAIKKETERIRMNLIMHKATFGALAD
jgi:hypothetical protein